MSDKSKELIQHCWSELCHCVQPGGPEGLIAMKKAIDAGPPDQPSVAALQEMQIADQRGFLDQIVSGNYLLSDKQQVLVQIRYPNLESWVQEVFLA